MRKMISQRRFTYRFTNGEWINILPISPNEYRQFSYTLDVELDVEYPELPLSSWFDDHRNQWMHGEYEPEAYDDYLKVYEDYQSKATSYKHNETLKYVLSKGVFSSIPKKDVDRVLRAFPDASNGDVCFEWLLHRVERQWEIFDLVDAILGITMPTESGVQRELDSFKVEVIEDGEMFPLKEWVSNKERKGGIVMPLWAEGLIALKELSGIMSLKDYLSLVGDPRHVDDNDPIPISKSTIVALQRLSAKSSTAAHEIEMGEKPPK